jgi:hypothetical protein
VNNIRYCRYVSDTGIHDVSRLIMLDCLLYFVILNQEIVVLSFVFLHAHSGIFLKRRTQTKRRNRTQRDQEEAICFY